MGANHETIADWIFDNQEHINTYMVIVESEHLSNEHLDDPNYRHQTNHMCISDAEEKAITSLQNKWFREKEINHYIEKYAWPRVTYNYQEEPEKEKRFKTRIEDALFRYQQNKEMILQIIANLDYAKYKLDEEGYPIEDDEGEYTLADEADVEKNKDLLLDQMLLPKVRSTYDRVYAMPEPLHYWDYRSFWHQFFFVENHTTQQTMWVRGQGGGSSSREENGRWAHAFAHLQKTYGIKTPSWHFNYDSHNILRCIHQYNSFKSFRYDLTGNYNWNRKDTESLFSGLLISPIRIF